MILFRQACLRILILGINVSCMLLKNQAYVQCEYNFTYTAFCLNLPGRIAFTLHLLAKLTAWLCVNPSSPALADA